MFERIVVRQQRQHDAANPLDLGALVESMVFYGRTELVLTPEVLSQLAKAWTPEGLIEIAEEGFLNLSFTHRHAGIRTERPASGVQLHYPVVYSIHESSGAPAIGMERFVPSEFEALLGRRGRARRLAARLYRSVTVTDIDDALADRVRADLLDPGFSTDVTRALLRLLVPDYPKREEVHLDVTDSGNGLSVATNIDFRLANNLYHRVIPPSHSTLSAEYILAHVIAAREALEASAAQDADIATDPAHAIAAAITLRFGIERARQNAEALASFQDFVLDDGRAIREAVNGGTKTLDELLMLFRHARRFRKWTGERQPNADLIKEYYRACLRDSWADGLPTKSVRWLLFTGLGAAIDAAGAGGLGTALALAASAGDAFFLDKLVRGWRPSQFVDNRLREFIQRKP